MENDGLDAKITIGAGGTVVPLGTGSPCQFTGWRFLACSCGTQRAIPNNGTSVPLGMGTPCQITVGAIFFFWNSKMKQNKQN